MKTKLFTVLTAILITISASVSAQTSKTVDLSKFYDGNDGAFVLYNAAANSYQRYNPKRCAERLTPASTFKIPNSLIGLESGVIPDTNFVIKWDGQPKPIKEWERDHTLKSAIFYSVVPYYQELARMVGREKMQHFLDTLDYGNKTIGENIDRFWLDGSIKISADEQVEFLKKLYLRKLPISEMVIQKVKDILPREEYGEAVLHFKTGTANPAENKYTAWLVGYVEKGRNVFFFAFNSDAPDYQQAVKLRNEKSREILKYLKVLE